MKDAGKTKAMPMTMSPSSPTQAVPVKGIFSRHLTTIMIQPYHGPIAKPPISAGRSDICKSRKDGKSMGRGNLTNIYNI